MFQKLKLKSNTIQVTDTRIISLISIIFIAVFVISSTAYYIFAIQPSYIFTSGSIISSLPDSISPSQIYWGEIESGNSVSRTVTLANTGGQSTSPLQFTTTDWSNSTDIGLQMSWDYQGTPLAAGASVDITFTLTAAVSASPSDFSFNIAIIA